ncbi:MAG: hypothetical protein MZV63_61945 [Marinilabiliales bacterium]|nr:hypothetical protein [Marinilabiliales bacterium]
MTTPTTDSRAIKLVTGSLALSSQRFINTSLIYSYGRTEDIPYGYMVELMGGRENNEFKWRTYGGLKVSYGNIFTRIRLHLWRRLRFRHFLMTEDLNRGWLTPV